MAVRTASKKSTEKKNSAWRQAAALVGFGLLLALLVEGFCRRSPAAAIALLWRQPLIVVYSWLVLTAWLSLSLLAARRSFALAALSAVWLGLAIADCVLLGFRVTPLSAVDFTLLQSVGKIFTVYLEPGEIAAIVLGAAVAVALLVLAWRKSVRRPVHWKAALLTVSGLFALAAGCTVLFIRQGVLATTFANLSEDYKDNGFVYCFGRSLFDRGIDRPADYSPQTVEDVLEDLRQAEKRGRTPTPNAGVNVVFVQLESFFDVNHLEGVAYSQPPTPVFSALKTTCSTGYLTVPSVGAGTANTEFEVLSGMNLDYFGTGEYPYKTVLQSTACESVCYDLKKYGYTAHAIHNNNATFYDRYGVFPNLGFDTFTSLEFMQGVSFNRQGWACDDVLTGAILDALASTDGPDVVYTISVQPHGKYPREAPEQPYPITVTGLEDQGLTWAFEYYLSQLHATDAFLGELVRQLSEWEEPVVLVAFGDHLPNFDIEDADLKNADIFQTEYILWSNYGLKKQDRDVFAYQLSALVQKRLSMNSGVMTRLHQNFAGTANYQTMLKLMEYDILYGDRLAYGGTLPYRPTTMQMGLHAVSIDAAVRQPDSIVVRGRYFTPYSVVYVNGEAVHTELLDGTHLRIPARAVVPGDVLCVVQRAPNLTELARSQQLVWTPPQVTLPEKLSNEEAGAGAAAESRTHTQTGEDTNG